MTNVRSAAVFIDSSSDDTHTAQSHTQRSPCPQLFLECRSIVLKFESSGLLLPVIRQYRIVPSAPPEKQVLEGWCTAIHFIPGSAHR